MPSYMVITSELKQVCILIKIRVKVKLLLQIDQECAHVSGSWGKSLVSTVLSRTVELGGQ